MEDAHDNEVTPMKFPQHDAPPDDGEEEETEEQERSQYVGVTAKKKAKRPGLGSAPARTDKSRPQDGWTNRDADLLWPEMLSEMKRSGSKHSAHDIDIRVVRLDPPPLTTLPPSFNGGAIQGDSSCGPGDALIRFIDDNYHNPLARSAVTYDLVFLWKSNGAMYGRGRLVRPSPEEIMALRRAQQQSRSGSPPPPQQYGQAQQQYQQAPQQPYQGYGAPPPPYGYPPPGYGYAPQQQQQQQPTYDPEVVNLRAQVAGLTGQLTQVLEHLRTSGVQVPAGLAAPPPAAPPAPPVYIQQPPQQTQQQSMRVGLAGVREALSVLRDVYSLRDELDSIIPQRGRDDEPAQQNPGGVTVVSAEPADDGLPFRVIPVPETSLKYAQDKETGNIDWSNTAFVNVDSEIGRKVVGLVGDFMQGVVKAAGVKPDGTVLPSSPPQLHGANGSAGGTWPSNL
jgi:hypothetical protein